MALAHIMQEAGTGGEAVPGTHQEHPASGLQAMTPVGGVLAPEQLAFGGREQRFHLPLLPGSERARPQIGEEPFDEVCGVGGRQLQDRADLQATHIVEVGRASNRAGAMGSPQLLHSP